MLVFIDESGDPGLKLASGSTDYLIVSLVAPAGLAKQFARAKPADVTEILKTLETFGCARKHGHAYTH